MPATTANARRKAHRPAQATPALQSQPVANGPAIAENGAALARAAGAFQPTSLKLPLALKAQIDETARKAGVSPHAFMLQTLATATEQASLREQFQRDAQAAQAEMKAGGVGHELSAVQGYFARLADFRAGKGRKPRKPSPKTIA